MKRNVSVLEKKNGSNSNTEIGPRCRFPIPKPCFGRTLLLLVWNYNNTHCHRHYHRLLLLERAVELRAAEKGGQGVTCPSRFFDRFRNKLFFFKRPFRPTRFSELLTALKLLLVLAQNASLTPARRHYCQFGCRVSTLMVKNKLP